MADRKINILLGIKSKMDEGLTSAKSSLASFGSSAVAVGKSIATGMVAAAAAVVAFSTKALTAYAEQEKSVSALKSSFRAYGDEVEVNTSRITQLASAIQAETGVSDDALVARAAKLKMLGVENDALGDALKATIALSQYGLEEEAAIRAVANAREGNYTALQKAIPALRSAATETEKQIILNDFLARGYDAQKATLGTLAGQWGLLKENVGDAWEEMGAAIAQNDTISGALEWLNEKVVQFGQSIKDWVSSGGVENFKAVMMNTLENISFGFQLGVANVQLFFSLFRDNSVFQYFSSNFGATITAAWEQLKYLGGWASAVWEKIKHPGGAFVPPSTDGMKAAQQNMLDAALGNQVKETDHYAEALKEREALLVAHTARVNQIEDDHLAALDGVYQKKLANEAVALNASVANNKAAEFSIYNGAKLVNEGISEQIDERVEKEEAALFLVSEANVSSSDDVMEAWKWAYTNIADESVKAADVAVTSAKRIKDSMDVAAGNTPSGGSFETSASYRDAKLQAAGINPNTPNGAVVSGMDAANLHSVTQEQILRELKSMNTNLNKNLTLG